MSGAPASSRGPARRSRRRLLAGALGVALAAGLAVSWAAGGSLVRPHQREVPWPRATPAPEQLALPSDSGTTLAGWYLPPTGERDAVGAAVLLHPKEGDRRAMLARAELLAAEGFACVLVDLQAHGESPGEAVTLGHLERHDAHAAMAFARERHPDLPLVVLGWSLGGAAAVLGAELEGGLGADALVLEEVFADLPRAVSDRFDHHMGAWARILTPLLTLQVPLRLGVGAGELAPVDHVAHVGCPVLVLGGDEDPYTPPRASELLHAAAPPGSELVLFEGAGHVDLLGHDPERWRASVLPFLERCLAP